MLPAIEVSLVSVFRCRCAVRCTQGSFIAEWVFFSRLTRRKHSWDQIDQKSWVSSVAVSFLLVTNARDPILKWSVVVKSELSSKFITSSFENELVHTTSRRTTSLIPFRWGAVRCSNIHGAPTAISLPISLSIPSSSSLLFLFSHVRVCVSYSERGRRVRRRSPRCRRINPRAAARDARWCTPFWNDFKMRSWDSAPEASIVVLITLR